MYDRNNLERRLDALERVVALLHSSEDPDKFPEGKSMEENHLIGDDAATPTGMVVEPWILISRLSDHIIAGSSPEVQERLMADEAERSIDD